MVSLNFLIKLSVHYLDEVNKISNVISKPNVMTLSIAKFEKVPISEEETNFEKSVSFEEILENKVTTTKPKIGYSVSITLTFNNFIIEETLAAKFLQTFKENIEIFNKI
jgi:hypothetical protein